MTILNHRRLRIRFLGLACLVTAIWQISGSAQSSRQFWPRAIGPFITIAWDPSPDPSVVGYVVYVGTQSGNYLGAYNVGNRTSFVYPHATINRRHFFAVAAYSSRFAIGPMSDEVSGFGRIVPASGHVPDFSIPPLGDGGLYGRCTASLDSCLESTVLWSSTGRISALTASAGQVWFVEDNQRIFTIDVDGTVRRIERPSRIRGQVDGLAIDPRFNETRHVYIQENAHLGDGRELIISRYREVLGSLRDRAVVVSSIRLAATGRAPFTLDEDGRIFVALPRDRSKPQPHDGVVFSLQQGGSHGQRLSGAMSWRGLSSPSSLVWDAAGRELWLSGVDGSRAVAVERLRLSSSPQTQRRANGAGRYLLSPAPDGRLLRIDRDTARAEPVVLGIGENVTAVVSTGRNVAFAATHSKSGSRILAIPIAD